MLMFTDTHAHIHSLDSEADTLEAIQDAVNRGVGRIVAIGVDYKDSFNAYKLAKKYDYIFATAGIHPEYADKYNPVEFDKFLHLAKNDEVIGIGECGLDFYYENNPSKEEQVRLFLDMIEISVQSGKPLIVHSRNAAKETLEVLSSELSGGRSKGGIFHCYDGALEVLDFLDDYNFYVSFAGNTTYKTAEVIREALKKASLDRILIETDTPYLAPVPVRGKPNKPGNVVHTAEFIAKELKITLEELSFRLEENFTRLFGKKPCYK